MKYLLFCLCLFIGISVSNAQQQLEIMIPIGISGFTKTSQDELAQKYDNADVNFSTGLSTGFSVRFAFSSLGKRFNLLADLGYRRLNANYTIEEEDANNPPVWLQRKRDVLYTDHCLYGGLNYRFNLIQSGNQGIALQAKTLLSFPIAGELRTEEELRFENMPEPQNSEDYVTKTIYDEDLSIAMHLNLGIGLLYSYRFSKFSLFLEGSYEYKYQLNSNNTLENSTAINWQNIYLGIGAGYLLSSASKIEGDQDAFFK